MRRRHAVAARVKDAAGQQGLRFLPGIGMIGPLLVKFSLNRLEQRAIEDGWLLAREDLALVPDLTDIEAVAQESGERSPGDPRPLRSGDNEIATEVADIMEVLVTLPNEQR
jgi:hypothetical protein